MDKLIRIAIGSDHAGYELKSQIIYAISGNKAFHFYDFGSYSAEPVDYPIIGHLVAKAVTSDNYDYGIVICGSGNGITMTVNKYSEIRSALCWNKQIAKLARCHNDANILALPGRFLKPDEAVEIVIEFLYSEFEGGKHDRRKKMIPS